MKLSDLLLEIYQELNADGSGFAEPLRAALRRPAPPCGARSGPP